MKTKNKVYNFILRLAVFPFITGLIITTYLIASIKRSFYFLRYGGEFINYEKRETHTIEEIYKQLKDNQQTK